jgi:hypothetical protein
LSTLNTAPRALYNQKILYRLCYLSALRYYRRNRKLYRRGGKNNIPVCTAQAARRNKCEENKQPELKFAKAERHINKRFVEKRNSYTVNDLQNRGNRADNRHSCIGNFKRGKKAVKKRIHPDAKPKQKFQRFFRFKIVYHFALRNNFLKYGFILSHFARKCNIIFVQNLPCQEAP